MFGGFWRDNGKYRDDARMKGGIDKFRELHLKGMPKRSNGKTAYGIKF